MILIFSAPPAVAETAAALRSFSSACASVCSTSATASQSGASNAPSSHQRSCRAQLPSTTRHSAERSSLRRQRASSEPTKSHAARWEGSVAAARAVALPHIAAHVVRLGFFCLCRARAAALPRGQSRGIAGPSTQNPKCGEGGGGGGWRRSILSRHGRIARAGPFGVCVRVDLLKVTSRTPSAFLLEISAASSLSFRQLFTVRHFCISIQILSPLATPGVNMIRRSTGFHATSQLIYSPLGSLGDGPISTIT